MTDRYSGICVGGPLDGQSVAHWSRVFMSLEREPLPEFVPDKMREYVPETAVYATQYPYTLESLYFSGGARIDFWVNGMSVAEAVQRVFSAYGEKHGAKAEIRQR